MAASATFVLKARLWFRRARLIMVPPRERQQCRLRAEMPLISRVQISQATSLRSELLCLDRDAEKVYYGLKIYDGL